jgi:UDP-N-acetylmuramate-alanine ligase
VLRTADAVVLGEVYAAGEAPIAGATAEALAAVAGCAAPVAGDSPV